MERGEPEESAFSFDLDLEGWSARGIDLDLGGGLVEWSIERAEEPVYAGTGSAELYLENWNDQGKIWLERAFALEPNTTYEVEVSYAFGTSDYGGGNLWNIITGVHSSQPQSHADLTYQGITGTGSDSPGFSWLMKRYSFTVATGCSGDLYVTIGVWGNWETPRTYYVDELQITFTPARE